MKNLMTFRKADIMDINLLVSTRVEVLRAANNLNEDADMVQIENESRKYYEQCLETDEHVTYLVFSDDEFVACGGISFYTIMPTVHNPTGRKAYIMNMYTRPLYRRQGIAMKTLDLLVNEARSRRVAQISLEATEFGRPLYERYGFTKMENEMELL